MVIAVCRLEANRENALEASVDEDLQLPSMWLIWGLSSHFLLGQPISSRPYLGTSFGDAIEMALVLYNQHLTC